MDAEIAVACEFLEMGRGNEPILTIGHRAGRADPAAAQKIHDRAADPFAQREVIGTQYKAKHEQLALPAMTGGADQLAARLAPRRNVAARTRSAARLTANQAGLDPTSASAPLLALLAQAHLLCQFGARGG